MSAPSVPTPEQLAEQRRRVGISQAQLAELIRTTHTTVFRMEHGARYVSPQAIARAAAALSVLDAAVKVAREVAERAGQQ